MLEPAKHVEGAMPENMFDLWLLHTFKNSTAESGKLQRAESLKLRSFLVFQKLFGRGRVFQEAVLARSNI